MLKLWNGRGNGIGEHVSVCAANQKQAVELLKKAGIWSMTLGELRGYYSDCWGYKMVAAVPTPELGVWVERKDGKIERLA